MTHRIQSDASLTRWFKKNCWDRRKNLETVPLTWYKRKYKKEEKQRFCVVSKDYLHACMQTRTTDRRTEERKRARKSYSFLQSSQVERVKARLSLFCSGKSQPASQLAPPVLPLSCYVELAGHHHQQWYFFQRRCVCSFRPSIMDRSLIALNKKTSLSPAYFLMHFLTTS